MEQSKTCVHVYKAQATCILLNDWGRGLCLPNQGTSPKPKQIMSLKNRTLDDSPGNNTFLS